MDARSKKHEIPLAVDLDGTLIATDLLWEGLFLLLRKNPLYLFLVPLWAAWRPSQAEARDRRPHRSSTPPACPTATRWSHGFARSASAGRQHHAGHRHAAQIRRGDRRPSRHIRRSSWRPTAPHNMTAERKRQALVEAYRRRRLRLCRQQPSRPQAVRCRARRHRGGARSPCRPLAAAGTAANCSRRRGRHSKTVSEDAARRTNG